MESALLRSEKLVKSRGVQEASLAVEMSRVYANDAAERVAESARNLAAVIAEADERAPILAAFGRLAPEHPINTIAARRRIADALIEANRYLW